MICRFHAMAAPADRWSPYWYRIIGIPPSNKCAFGIHRGRRDRLVCWLTRLNTRLTRFRGIRTRHRRSISNGPSRCPYCPVFGTPFKFVRSRGGHIFRRPGARYMSYGSASRRKRDEHERGGGGGGGGGYRWKLGANARGSIEAKTRRTPSISTRRSFIEVPGLEILWTGRRVAWKHCIK